MLLYQILAFTIHGKIYKSHVERVNLKYQLLREMKNLIHLIRIYINRIENTITFKIKQLELRQFITFMF